MIEQGIIAGGLVLSIDNHILNRSKLRLLATCFFFEVCRHFFTQTNVIQKNISTRISKIDWTIITFESFSKTKISWVNNFSEEKLLQNFKVMNCWLNQSQWWILHWVLFWVICKSKLQKLSASQKNQNISLFKLGNQL